MQASTSVQSAGRTAPRPSDRAPVTPHLAARARFAVGALGLLSIVALAALGKGLTAAGCPLPLPLTTLLLSAFAGEAASRVRGSAGIDPPAEVPLALGMILLGAQVDGDVVAGIGLAGLGLLAVHWGVVLGLFHALGRVGVLPGRTAGLLATGLCGCGLSAVTASARGDPRAPASARSLAVAASLLAGIIGFAAMPPLARLVGLDARQVARWAGLAMPTTAEAVLVAAAHSPEAFRLAGAWRFVVNALQGVPIVVYLAQFAPATPEAGRGRLRRTVGPVFARLPAFTWGLAAFGALALSGAFAPAEKARLGRLVSWAFLTALAGVGFRTRVRPLLAAGPWALLAALLGWGLGAAALLALVVWTGSW